MNDRQLGPQQTSTFCEVNLSDFSNSSRAPDAQMKTAFQIPRSKADRTSLSPLWKKPCNHHLL